MVSVFMIKARPVLLTLEYRYFFITFWWHFIPGICSIKHDTSDTDKGGPCIGENEFMMNIVNGLRVFGV